MSNQPSNEMEEIERQFEQIIEGLIDLLSSDDQANVTRKEANRREKVRIEARAAQVKDDELKRQCEAFEEEKKRREQRIIEEWRQLVAELEQLLGNVSEARPLLQRMIELIPGRRDELPDRAVGPLLQKNVDENRSDFQTHLEEELEELRQRLIGSLPTEKKVERAEDPPTHIDFVTGAFNFRFLDEVLTWETARADRYDYPLTMILIDLDRFKLVNDTFGYIVGGRILRSVADLLRSSVRLADVVFRTGDDEFMILLPFTDLKGGLDLRDRILRRASTSALLPGRSPEVTMTIGMAEYRVGEGKDSFVARVEEALFRARRDGDDGLSGVPVPIR
jgi:diguanylate cyclase (GGDEF)-like protein